MQDKKFYQKAFKWLFLTLFVIVFAVSSEVAEANYTIGIVGIGDKSGKYNLGDYIDLDDPTLSDPMVNAQENFKTILDTELSTIFSPIFTTVEKSEQAQMARKDELTFQEVQARLALIERGEFVKVVKLFDEKLDYIIYGYIANFTVTHREAFGTSNLSVRIDVTVNIIDTSNGKVVCTATGKGESASHGEGNRKAFKFGGKAIPEVCWGEALDKALTQSVEKINKRI